MSSNTAALVLKSELVKTRIGVDDASRNVQDALFSLDLEGIVDLMDPNRNQFTIMELIGYRLVGFPPLDDAATFTGSESQNRSLLDVATLTDNTNEVMNAWEKVFLDTSVPDASQPTTVGAAANVDERWIASATNIVHDGRTAFVRSPALVTGSNPLIVNIENGRNYWKDWVDLQDEKGRGFLVAAPRLIVRYSRVKDCLGNILEATEDKQTFQIRLRYRIKKINKSQMWQMLLQQTPGETLIRSGSAAFP